jgi:hypothetical protein
MDRPRGLHAGESKMESGAFVQFGLGPDFAARCKR